MSVTFELRVGAYLRKFGDETPMTLPNVHVRRTVSLPCDFIPGELALAFSKPRETVLVERLKVDTIRWDETAQKLIVFAEVQNWTEETYTEYFESMGAYGWEFWAISFSELEASSEVSSLQLISALKEYAERGAAISARTVNSIIDRVTLSRADIEDLKQSAVLGKANQNKRHFPKEAHQYCLVYEHLAQK